MELLDIIDKDDNIVGRASKKEAYERLLPHRIVHVMVLDRRGRIALQLRSKDVKFCPLHWSTSVGGHVQSGETYEEAAIREYEEELGVKIGAGGIEFIGKDGYSAKDVPKKSIAIFKTIFDGKFKVNPKEVEKACFFTVGEIQGMIDNGERFHPELLFILKNHLGIR